MTGAVSSDVRGAVLRSTPAPRRLASIAIPLLAAAAVAIVVPATLNSFWVYTLTAGLITAVAMQSFGVITGRAGVMSLCQMSFAAIGAWVTCWSNVHEVPGGFYVWGLLGALAAGLVGVVVGFPALRLRSVNLAIATLAFAAGVDVVFTGGNSFPGANEFDFVDRPTGFATDEKFFVFTLIVVTLLFLLLAALDRSRLGAALVEVRFSERAAAAHGIDVARTKLLAFGISAALAGYAGALLAAHAQVVTPVNFALGLSIAYFAIAIILGVHHWEAALLGGVLGSVFPVLLDKVSLPQDAGAIAFGVIAVLVLKEGKGQAGQADLIREKRMARRARRLIEDSQDARSARPVAPSVRRGSAAPPRPVKRDPVLDVKDVTVCFGAVTAVDAVSLSIERGSILGLIGPNGAGKSTLVNAITGFVPYEGRVEFEGISIDRLSPHVRARRGIRRSFQVLRVPPGLTAGAFVRSVAGRRLTDKEVAEHLDWFGCPPADVPVHVLDVGTRRILEVAALAAAAPKVLLLDEPGAGQAASESLRLAEAIAQIPDRVGSAVVLIEHDIDLVRATCETVVVMDFGKVIASGEPAEVFSNHAVVDAYLGGAPIVGDAPSLTPTTPTSASAGAS